MKKLFRLMAMAIVVMAFAACGKTASPENAADSVLKSYQKGDYVGMINQYHFRDGITQDQKEQFASLLEEKLAPELEKKGGIASYSIDETIMAEDEQSAVVRYTINFGNGTSSQDTMKIVLIDGKWMPDAGK